MSVGVIADDLIVRVNPADYDAALRRPGARLFDFTGKPMRGWLVVDGTAIDDDDALAAWVETGTAYAGSLPAKASAAAAPKARKRGRK